jgi:hypothetical protein
MSKLSNAAEVTKSDRKISKTTLQEENNIKDVIAASSSKAELDFHPEIHKIYVDSASAMPPRRKSAQEASSLLAGVRPDWNFSLCFLKPPPHACTHQENLPAASLRGRVTTSGPQMPLPLPNPVGALAPRPSHPGWGQQAHRRRIAIARPPQQGSAGRERRHGSMSFVIYS